MKSPCRNCENRSPTCHSDCDKYKDFAGKCEEARNERYKQKDIERYRQEMFVKAMIKNYKNKWKKP